MRLERHVSWSTLLSPRRGGLIRPHSSEGRATAWSATKHRDAVQEQIHCRPHLFPRLLDHTQTVRRDLGRPKQILLRPRPSLGVVLRIPSANLAPTPPALDEPKAVPEDIQARRQSLFCISLSDGHAMSRCLPRFSREIPPF